MRDGELCEQRYVADRHKLRPGLPRVRAETKHSRPPGLFFTVLLGPRDVLSLRTACECRCLVEHEDEALSSASQFTLIAVSRGTVRNGPFLATQPSATESLQKLRFTQISFLLRVAFDAAPAASTARMKHCDEAIAPSVHFIFGIRRLSFSVFSATGPQNPLRSEGDNRVRPHRSQTEEPLTGCRVSPAH